jgi:predicted dehydrogenase
MGINIAVVGTGSVARNNYLPYLSRQQDVSLTYLSRTRARADECAAKFGGRVAGSARELLDWGPDAVLVLTRETDRFEAASALLDAGSPRRLLFEKPLVARDGQARVCEDDFFRARDLLRRAADCRAETAMIFNYRFFDQTQLAMKAVAERNLGRMTEATLLVNYACWSHCIDLLNVFGGRAAEICALAGEPHGKDNAVDAAAAFRLACGAAGVILGTSGMKFDLPLYDMAFCFERGLVRFGDLDVSLDVFDNAGRLRQSHALVGNNSRWDQYRASFEKSLAAYLESIRLARPPPVPGAAGLEELQFEAALRRSIAQKRPVQVQEEFPCS